MKLTKEQIEQIKMQTEIFKAKSGRLEEKCNQLKEKTSMLPAVVADADAEFERLTNIKKKDIPFLVFASTLQVSRQYLTSYMKKSLSDKEAAKRTPFHTEEHSDRTTRRYYASIDEIASNPVPFDALRKSEIVKNNGNPMLSGSNHRFRAIAHDPVIGCIVGPSNIMTKTITVATGGLDFETYHVGTGIVSNGRTEYGIDMLTHRADTALMFQHVYSRLQSEGIKGWEALSLSIGKELVHLMSDVRTRKSLPIPFVSAISPNTSNLLNMCGIDVKSVVAFSVDFFASKFINMIIAYAHSLCYNPKTDGPIEAYEARTRNIIYYSSCISLASTTIQTLYRVHIGDTSAFAKFDFGGAADAIAQIWRTPAIISDMKNEYIINQTINFLNN